MAKKMKPALKRAIYIALAALVAVCSVLVYVGWNEYTYRFSSPLIKECQIKIYPKDTFQDVVQSMQSEGCIKSAERMERMAIKHDQDSVHAGYYKFESGDSYRTILTRLARGRQTPMRITFNNVRTLTKLAELVSSKTMTSEADFAEYFRHDARATGLGVNYIARFMPNTYEIYWTITPEQFATMMKENYDKFWNSNSRLAKAEKLGFTPDEVMTLASIVIEETKAEKEMTTVAGVYINRLAIDMPLQADPTVKFAVGDFGLRRILNKHTSFDSPYNTYKNRGLPPGPICSPALVAVDAVLNYTDSGNQHKWLYFCANSDFSGTHAFAATLSDHNRNAQAYHRELNRRGIK